MSKLNAYKSLILRGEALTEEIAFVYVDVEEKMFKVCKACGKLLPTGGDCLNTCKNEIVQNYVHVYNKIHSTCQQCKRPFLKCTCGFEEEQKEEQEDEPE